VQIKFRADGWRLAALALTKDLRAPIDVGALPQHQHVLTMLDIVERLDLPPGTQPLDMKPESVYVMLDDYVEKRIPVRLSHEVSFREGYGLVGPPEVIPDSVIVGGAARVVRRIDAWPPQRRVFRDLRSSVDEVIPLADTSAYKLTFTPSSVRLKMSVQPFAEKIFNGIPVEVVAVPPNREVMLIPPRIEVVVRGGIDQLTIIEQMDFRAHIDFRAILADTSGFMEPQITSPEGVQVVARRPERIQYIVRTRL
jgi:YbbR domain-containing protein